MLAYHNVRPDRAPQRGERALHLSRSDFARQLDFIGAHCDVIPLADLCAAPPVDGRPRIVITLDDGYLGALTDGLEELTRRGMPATFFIVPGRLGAAFWWDRLADASAGAIAPEHRARLFESLRGEGESIIAWAEQQGMPVARELPIWARAGTRDDVARAYAAPRMTLGAHTWTHPNLAALAPDRLTEELDRPRTWLTEHFPRALPWLSFPYGRHGEGVIRAAGAAGYAGCLAIGQSTVWIGEATSSEPPIVVPRLDVPAGWSLSRFALSVTDA